MATDDWLLSNVLLSPCDVFVRLYTWRFPAITIGYHQVAARACDLSRVGTTPIIRRLTGGRALYHDCSELTYAIAADSQAASSEFFRDTLVNTSHNISSLLQSFLSYAGIAASYASKDYREAKKRFHETAPCFASTGRHELVNGEQKVVASAQRRINSAYVQHGSIKWRGVAHHPALATGPEVNAAYLTRQVEPEVFQEAVTQFGEVLQKKTNLTVQPYELSHSDKAEIGRIALKIESDPLCRRTVIEQFDQLVSL